MMRINTQWVHSESLEQQDGICDSKLTTVPTFMAIKEHLTQGSVTHCRALETTLEVNVTEELTTSGFINRKHWAQLVQFW